MKILIFAELLLETAEDLALQYRVMDFAVYWTNNISEMLIISMRLRILYMTNMIQRHRHIVIYLLLLSYLLLGAVGYLETLMLSGFGTNPQVLTQSKSGHPSTTKVYWTQYKHIPSTVKISVPSPAIFAPPELPRVRTSSISFTLCTSSIHPDPLFSEHSSRAPPQI